MDEAPLADKGKPARYTSSLVILPIDGVERKIVPINGEIFCQAPGQGEILSGPSDLQSALGGGDAFAETAVLGVSGKSDVGRSAITNQRRPKPIKRVFLKAAAAVATAMKRTLNAKPAQKRGSSVVVNGLRS